MAHYRMAFRLGVGGQPLWPDCFRLGVAAIQYDPFNGINLSRFPRGEPQDRWAALHHSQRRSLECVAYEMKPGDTIYVKDGPHIVCKGEIICEGKVKKPYVFAAERIVDERDIAWEHQVRVLWQKDFARLRVQIGKDQYQTVTPLGPADLEKLGGVESATAAELDKVCVAEGESYAAEVTWRRRNHGLIQAKKALNPCECEVCGFDFGTVYGRLGQNLIVAHHLHPIAGGERVTTLEDIALLCANCHLVVHRQPPPISVQSLRSRIRSAAQDRRSRNELSLSENHPGDQKRGSRS